jgi:DNA-nicking Smr family endonuclease
MVDDRGCGVSKKLPPDMDLFRQSFGVGKANKIPTADAAGGETMADLLAADVITAESQPPPPAPTPAKNPLAAQPPALPELILNSGAGVDGKNFEKLRRGDYPIAATLDLHGLTQAQALSSLRVFIATQADRGSRCVLIITGKGKTGGDFMQQGGVLRQNLPRWLNLPPLRPRILALATAQRRHGGDGAFYLLLKKTA